MFNRVVITQGLGRRLLVTSGYGGLRTFTTEEPAETEWIEHSCEPHSWEEHGCQPTSWEEERFAYPRLETEGLGRMPNLAIPETPPAPPVTRYGVAMPSGRMDIRPFRMVEEPLATPWLPVATWFQVTPIGKQSVSQDEIATNVLLEDPEDCYIDNTPSQQNLPHYTGAFITIREVPTDIKRGIMAFRSHGITAGATITSAILTMLLSGTFTDAEEYYVHRLVRDFDQTVCTWNTPWAVPGCGDGTTDYDNSIVATETCVVGGSSLAWDVTAIVQAAIDASEDDILLRVSKEESLRIANFLSTDFGTGPTLDVTYEA